MDYKTIIVTNGVAVPQWPHDTFCADGKDIYEFTKQPNTYATDAPDGCFGVEMFGELVWQYEMEPGSHVYRTVLPEAYINCKNSFETYKERCDYNGTKCRLFIPFIPSIDKQEEGETVVSTLRKDVDIIRAANESIDARLTGTYLGNKYKSKFIEGAQWQLAQSYSKSEVIAIVVEVLKRSALRELSTYHKTLIKNIDYNDLLTK